ncbi:MAG: TRAP transporter small permease [Acetobacteraceae bacterium]
MARTILDRTADLLGFIAGVILIVMMLHITLDVTLRYLFASPLHDTVEIVSTYYIVAIVFLPLALVEKLNAHIVVELLTQHFPRRAQELLIGVVALGSAGYFGAFAWRTWQDAVQKYNVGEVTLGTAAITVWPTRFYLPVGCAVITVMLIYKAFRLFAGDNSVLSRKLEFEAHD